MMDLCCYSNCSEVAKGVINHATGAWFSLIDPITDYFGYKGSTLPKF